MSTSIPTSDLDLYSDDVLAEPYEHYRRLREAGPAVWLERHNAWVIVRYDAVRAVLRDWKTFSSASGVALNDTLNTAMQGNTLGSDPPLHDLLRNVVASRMTSQALRPVKEMIDQRAEELVERLVTQRSFDAVEDLAQVLPQSIVPDFIGLPQEGREHMLDWAEATFNAMGPMNELCTHAIKKLPELFGYARQIAASGNLQPGSFGAGVLEAQREGRITAAQCPQLFTAYLVPSLDTTISAVGSAIWLFGRYPDQWDRVREDPSLIPNAFEEVLRLEPPLQSFSRLATSDYDVEGISIPAGSRVVVLFASARNQSIPQETDVLIVGGGPVGLSAAVELGRRGVQCMVIEPRLVVSQLRPRAKTTSVRTMEHFRRWGLAERLREVAPLKVDWSQDVVFCTTLLGHEVMRFPNCFGLSPQRTDLFAESGQQIAQPLVEEVLREAVADLESCRLCLGWSLHTLQQRDDDVLTTITNEQGEQRQIRASYVLGCDGARSVVRAAIEARYVGASDLRPNFGFVFRAPGLAQRLPHGPAVQYWVLNPAYPGVMGRMDMGDLWWAGVNGVSAEIGQADPHALIHGLVGAEIDAEVLGTDPWTARMLLADRYRNGRVFLVGDAAHLNPPWGGHGFNTGISDAVNIGWKLAAVLDGWGGDDLLASYEAERRPVAERTIGEATANMSVLAPELGSQALAAPGLIGEQARQAAAQVIQASKDREFHSLGIVLGYQYDASPVIVGDGTPPLPESQAYVPTARPGARLPHLWLPDGASL